MSGGTIFALATAPGRAAVAVVRGSGPGAAGAVRALAGDLPPARRATLRSLRSETGTVFDHALVLWFPGPASYTGEDAFELHLHGGPAVVRACQDALSAHGLRPAEPGEFTRRAFERGKLDLAQAEAVADLVDAETEAQRRQALDQLDGDLSRRYAAWRDDLLDALALLEAQIDFPDEDLPDDLLEAADAKLVALTTALEAALADADRGEQIRDGWRVALIGAPNAGKSTLFNALVGRDAAIVTPIAGTTRDVIEASLVLGGYKVVLADTAGVRATADPIEAEGVRRARAWAESAAHRLWVVDAASSDDGWREGQDLVRAGDTLVLSKIDLTPSPAAAAAREIAEVRGLDVAIVSNGEAKALGSALQAAAVRALSGGEFPSATRRRHRVRLEEALSAVRRARTAPAAELASEDLRAAAAALGRVAGTIGAEDVLDVVFGAFCIGK